MRKMLRFGFLLAIFGAIGKVVSGRRGGDEEDA